MFATKIISFALLVLILWFGYVFYFAKGLDGLVVLWVGAPLFALFIAGLVIFSIYTYIKQSPKRK